jgi:hypothetical protein
LVPADEGVVKCEQCPSRRKEVKGVSVIGSRKEGQQVVVIGFIPYVVFGVYGEQVTHREGYEPAT